MGGVKIKFNHKGFQELRSHPAVMEVLQDQANGIAERANADARFPDGFTTDAHPGGNRGRVTVFQDNINGLLAEAHHGALSKAVGSGG